MKRYIHIKKADREFILNLFKVSGRMVDYALRFDGERGNTELARKIRKVAMEHGGIIMTVIPEQETFYDADGYMRQYLLTAFCWSLRKRQAMAAVMFITKERWFVTMTM